MIVKQLKEEEKYSNQKIKDVLITIPAYLIKIKEIQQQKQETLQVLKILR